MEIIILIWKMRGKSTFFNKGKRTFAIVGDGDCEKWYFQLLKDNEELKINIFPQLLKKASLKKQYEYVKDQANTYDKVFWIVDYDVIAKESKEFKKGDEKRSDEFARYYKELSTLDNVEILVVNTCFEYWLLLHFKYSKKNYRNCDETGRDLKKKFPTYEKTEKFYKKNNADIYTSLKPNLSIAIENAKRLGDFDIKDPNNPVCEIHKLFHEDGRFKVE
ncbi:RloB family protein [Elizabethkingia meningoseptica]|nr:RloB family protein [Elizabethkingia meningoseptica]MBG0512637.1 RloB domain-containing protein [Elizabethkingia meningoseptica]MDE5435239.1 RloB family protein [Elizabethkingia meningoseptica]MDE5450414.1 RloB family protein [Elizabethkingia meningoseptica]MDE5483086.1 RloB family protein [Elizabethkingia meningoseptica]MDE5520038.1 RloB family protein [Elizabethkingia meningoseptica]